MYAQYMYPLACQSPSCSQWGTKVVINWLVFVPANTTVWKTEHANFVYVLNFKDINVCLKFHVHVRPITSWDISLKYL